MRQAIIHINGNSVEQHLEKTYGTRAPLLRGTTNPPPATMAVKNHLRPAGYCRGSSIAGTKHRKDRNPRRTRRQPSRLFFSCSVVRSALISAFLGVSGTPYSPHPVVIEVLRFCNCRTCLSVLHFSDFALCSYGEA